MSELDSFAEFFFYLYTYSKQIFYSGADLSLNMDIIARFLSAKTFFYKMVS